LTLPPLVGVVTYNPMSTLRFELLERTVRSIEKAFPTAELLLLDNGSTDGSWDAIVELLGGERTPCIGKLTCSKCGRWHLTDAVGDPAGNFTPGAGCHRLYYHMFAHTDGGQARAPFWVFSDDDMAWKEGSETKLRRFWEAARETDIAILGGLLEPVWHWNTPREVVEYGGVRVLVRDSAPGAGWTLGEPRLLPVPCNEKLHCFGFDYETCKLLRSKGYKVAQMDLAEHIGWGFSTHGNEANEHVDGRPLDRDKWGV
jgi:hypothetical protein